MTREGSLFDVPPAAIGRFRVLHQIGAGTCGPVFRAVDPESETTVAVKLFTSSLPPGRTGDLAEALARLVRTLPRMTASVTPLSAGLHGHTPFLATSFAPGDSLDVALKQYGPAMLADVAPRLASLARALDAAADGGVVHGALHPRDVIVSESDTALTGVGIWPMLTGLGLRMPVRRPYRAPELGPGDASPAADQFSLAALAYEWLTGRRAPTAFVPGDMAPVPGGPREALALVFGRALHADPEHRFPTCAAFVADLEALASPEDAPSNAPPAGAARPRRRGRAAEPAPLPLDAFPAEADAPLPLRAPADTTGPEADDGQALVAESEPAPTTEEWDQPLPGRAHPAPSTESHEAPALIAWQPSSVAHQVAGGGRRLAAAALLGLVLGVAVGYVVWGRDEGSPAAVAAPAVQEPPSAPVAIEDPAPVPSDPTAAPVQPAPVVAAPPSGAAAVATGNLLIRSTPAGATVFVDGENRGVTPLTLSTLALGTRVVRVQRDGFIADERLVALTAERPSRSLDVRLRREPVAPAPTPTPAPAAATGVLVVESRPSGASVTVDGRAVGTTPLTLDRVAPGARVVTMRLAGYRMVTATVQVVAGERARAAASMTRLQEP